jgi:hypothetical protein
MAGKVSTEGVQREHTYRVTLSDLGLRDVDEPYVDAFLNSAAAAGIAEADILPLVAWYSDRMRKFGGLIPLDSPMRKGMVRKAPDPPPPTAAEEIAEIRDLMRNQHGPYWKGPKAETLQRRFRELIEMQADE